MNNGKKISFSFYKINYSEDSILFESKECTYEKIGVF